MAESGNSGNKLLGYLLGGLLIGPILAVGCPFLGLVVGGSASTDANDYSDTPLLIGLVAGLLAPLLLPVPLLFKPASRPWGVGILIGAALTMIVLGGICASFIYLLSSESS